MSRFFLLHLTKYEPMKRLKSGNTTALPPSTRQVAHPHRLAFGHKSVLTINKKMRGGTRIFFVYGQTRFAAKDGTVGCITCLDTWGQCCGITAFGPFYWFIFGEMKQKKS